MSNFQERTEAKARRCRERIKIACPKEKMTARNQNLPCNTSSIGDSSATIELYGSTNDGRGDHSTTGNVTAFQGAYTDLYGYECGKYA